jgi:uncharacterized protein
MSNHAAGPEPLTCEDTARGTTRDVALRGAQLILGLFGWGLAIALFIRSHLGLGPWDAFHYGLHLQTGITVGTASILAGFVIIFVNLALKVKPGIATVLNMVLIGVFIDLLLPVIPDAGSTLLAVAYFATALTLTGVASGAYIGAGFGHGPRDGLMLGLAVRTGVTVRRVRTLIELAVLALGWLMGGTVGIGTVVITLTIGHFVHWGLKLFGALPPPAVERIARAERTRRRWPFRRAA